MRKGRTDSVDPLALHQLGKEAALVCQFVVGSFLDDPAAVEDDDAVAVLHGGKPMGDHHAGAIQSREGVGDLLLRLVVEGAPPEMPP